uniref:Uncharacterized protein n=1 Tax=Brassica campestris TaxID=3711 RepID=M4EFP8_BRACM
MPSHHEDRVAKEFRNGKGVSKWSWEDPKFSEEAIQLPTSTIEQPPSLSERLVIPTLLACFNLHTLDLDL